METTVNTLKGSLFRDHKIVESAGKQWNASNVGAAVGVINDYDFYTSGKRIAELVKFLLNASDEYFVSVCVFCDIDNTLQHYLFNINNLEILEKLFNNEANHETWIMLGGERKVDGVSLVDVLETLDEEKFVIYLDLDAAMLIALNGTVADVIENHSSNE